jgi:hypothetical protein
MLKQDSKITFFNIVDKNATTPSSKARVAVDCDLSATNFEIAKKARTEFSRSCWFLDQNMVKNVSISQQALAQVGNYKIEFFNFGQLLEQRQIIELSLGVGIIAALEQKHCSTKKRISNIVVNSYQQINSTDGTLQNGRARRQTETIELYPNSIKQIEHRIKGVSNFLGTLIHESGHFLADKFTNDWHKLFSWRLLDRPMLRVGLDPIQYTCEEPEHCPSQYASYHPEEDFCDSLVAAICNPSALHSERLNFLRKFVLPSECDINKINSAEIVSIDTPTLPELPPIIDVVANRRRPLTFKIKS